MPEMRKQSMPKITPHEQHGDTAMNDSTDIPETGFAPDEAQGTYCGEAEITNEVPFDIANSTGEITEDSLKRIQLYMTYLEELILRKNAEVSELQRIMESRVEEETQKRKINEHVMIHQARRAAMGEMLGTIGHQWRQPLNAISLISQTIKDAWEYNELDGKTLNHSVLQIMQQTSLLSRTIDEFRGFLTPVNDSVYFSPKLCVEEVVALLSGWFSNFRTIEIRMTNKSEETIQVVGCQHAFRQVIHNLLCNANEAIKENRSRIGTSFHGVIEVCFHRIDDDVVIGVSDNGGGIDESIMEHIFEPYFTTKTNANELGIGLYISRLIVENSMNGILWAENIPDGMLFGIRLPLAIVDGRRV